MPELYTIFPKKRRAQAASRLELGGGKNPRARLRSGGGCRQKAAYIPLAIFPQPCYNSPYETCGKRYEYSPKRLGVSRHGSFKTGRVRFERGACRIGDHSVTGLIIS
jgi:hypothetical protein